MSEPFRTRETAIEAVNEAPVIAGSVQPVAKEAETRYAQDTPERVDLYELERGHKIADSYFGLREIAAGDWNVKMNLARIDKYIKQTIQEKQYDNTVSNYKNLIAEIESKVNSTKLMGKARLQRILTYINLMQKTNHINELKNKFFSGIDG